jgi:alkanesulfonate monooxygenase SsuD/methylene tetrahydromethanopterin reductase-like flavin-dependent oxidoreductase (luciferase family)
VVQRGEERAVDVCGRPLGDVANKTTPVNGFLDPSPKSKFEGRPEFELESLRRTAMIGTPEQVIERLRYYEQLGVDEFSFWCDNSLPHDEKRKPLELFIKEVTPAFV